MAPDIPFAALIHISDLHFGSIFHNRERWFHKLAKKTPFQGFFPHDYQIAQALSQIITMLAKKYRERKTPVVVIHSGDLTRAGKRAEFSVGSTFLHSHFDEAGYRVGLMMKRSSESSVAFDSRQLERICSHLQKDTEERHSIRVAALHHPLCDPEGASSATSRLRLNHRENVARKLREAAPHLVLSGHVRVPAFFPTAGDRPCPLDRGLRLSDGIAIKY